MDTNKTWNENPFCVLSNQPQAMMPQELQHYIPSLKQLQKEFPYSGRGGGCLLPLPRAHEVLNGNRHPETYFSIPICKMK